MTDRRTFLAGAGSALLFGLGTAVQRESLAAVAPSKSGAVAERAPKSIRLMFGGDVMTGRGIDQIMRHPSKPELHERSARSAQVYVDLAEKASGAIPRKVDASYIWGDVRSELDRLKPRARIVNLETAITTSDAYWVGKSIHYRMHPANVACLTAAKIDCCTLANNHVLDWAYVGLRETLKTLHSVGIATAGAGDSLAEARAPVIRELGDGVRLLVFAYGSVTSGVPSGWQAHAMGGGINRLDETDPTAIERVASEVRAVKRPGDIVVISLHWGTNWGYEITADQQRIAHGLVDEAGVDIVFGHSSHHPRPIEVYRGKLVLYGCGDLINDYEGIQRHKAYRPELGFIYMPEIDVRTGGLVRLLLMPTRIARFRVNQASTGDADWICQMLEKAGAGFGTRFRRGDDGAMELGWT